MTFEEYMYNTYGDFWDKGMFGDDSIPKALKDAWNAAKEDSKPIVKTVFVECFHGGVDLSYYELVGLRVNDRAYHFTHKAQAEKWAIENGYRIADN